MKERSLSNVTIVMQVHEGTKPFKCDTCNAAFTSKQGLKGHIASIHGGTKSFKCTVCDAIFARNTHLSGHQTSIQRSLSNETIVMQVSVISIQFSTIYTIHLYYLVSFDPGH